MPPAPQREWVPFYSALTEGNKRALPRAVRFVFLEVCLRARRGEGQFEILSDCDLAFALGDLLGGDHGEVAVACERLFSGKEPLLAVVESEGKRWVKVPAWDRWRPGKSSTERSRSRRGLADGGFQAEILSDATSVTFRAVASADRCNGNATDIRPMPVASGVGCNGDATAIRSMPVAFDSEKGADATVSSSLFSSSSSLSPTQTRARDTLVRPPIDPGPLTETEQSVREVIESGRDLYPPPHVTDAEIAAAARRVVTACKAEPKIRNETPAFIVDIVVAKLRSERGRYPAATAEQIFGRLDEALRWVLGDYRSGKRVPQPRHAPDALAPPVYETSLPRSLRPKRVDPGPEHG